ncbi:MAG: hypothetical protein IT176_13955 [Acidobacteria bacterium]|nr:hypothetical protein [Acidobacteriota bacterium]
MLKPFSFSLVLLASSAGVCMAQPSSKVLVAVDGSYQAPEDPFRSSAAKILNAEEETFDADYKVGGAAGLEIGASVRVWRALAVGVLVSRTSGVGSAKVTGRLPHPLYFDRFRTTSGEVGGLKRRSTIVGLQVGAVLGFRARGQVLLYAGPAFVAVQQPVVEDFTYTDAYPYDAASFERATTAPARDSAMGFQVGGDVGFFFSRHAGLGFCAQFARAKIHLRAGGETIALNAGGPRAAAGLRVRF